MSLNINFDHSWSYYHQPIITNDDIANATVTDIMNICNWSPAELPHISRTKSETTFTNKSEKWWYRKHFQCILSDSQLEQSVSLTFKSSDNNYRNSLAISSVIWLDAVNIFSGVLQIPQTSIDLPKTLLYSSDMENRNYQHTLIVCSMDACLSFSASLILPHDAIISIKDIHDNATIRRTSDLSQKHDNIYNYVASFDDVNKHNTNTSDSKRVSLPTYDKQEFCDIVTEKIIDRENNQIADVNRTKVPLLTIVMLIVGSRGDIEPIIAYGKALRAVGHRVRLATHEKFRKFVRDNDLEYFPLAGDPDEIMSFMVNNSGIVPSISSILKGNLFRRRRLFFDILKSTWLACTNNDDETDASFQAEVIIANPISYGHIHCAQKLGIPLHMVFTMPYSPTIAFPHPLANIDYSTASNERINVFSYSSVETLMWLGIGDLINKFRRTILDLPSLNISQVRSMMVDEKVPYTYCWSPSLVPKPSDWPFYIDVSGYFFLNLGKNYKTPPDDLLAFLGLQTNLNNHIDETSLPIFIGFGSIIGHDSHRLLDIILKSLMQTGYRALLSGFDIDSNHLPKNILKIDDIPHDWLFQYVSAVCHHGGAGTTAAALRAGKPCITIPFFGDQFLWGHIVERSCAGPPPLPAKDVTVEKLVEAFKYVHKPTTQIAAKRLQEAILLEDGCKAAVHSFHANLPISQMQSDLESTYAACFRLDEFNLQVSRPVAEVLLSAGVVAESQFRYHSTREWKLTHHNNTSTSNVHERPSVDDFHLSTATSKCSACCVSKNDAQDVNGSRKSSGSVVGSLIADVNSTMKPIINVLLSTTELDQSKCRNTKKDLNKTITSDKCSSISTSLSINNEDLKLYNFDEISILAHDAANISGFTPEVCQNILLQFMTLKNQLVQTPKFSFLKHHRSQLYTLGRSQSFDDF
ncbi:unnamed protein product [Adineta steineri]|uniref:Sterol 3-beta-glucosyltransferase n=1 Tax=Adineta steineri TaxID=433720 RepID=A0A819KKY7_9BILA|nr:unnamed protein product [Adineta steineri]